jgi:hypothetical protein
LKAIKDDVEEKMTIKYDIILNQETDYEVNEHKYYKVQRISWNICGTMLSCIESNGIVHVYQKKSADYFEEVLLN